MVCIVTVCIVTVCIVMAYIVCVHARARPSVRPPARPPAPSTRPPVRPSVSPSVRPSVRPFPISKLRPLCVDDHTPCMVTTTRVQHYSGPTLLGGRHLRGLANTTWGPSPSRFGQHYLGAVTFEVWPTLFGGRHLRGSTSLRRGSYVSSSASACPAPVRHL